MSKFNVGDLVRVKPDANVIVRRLSFAPQMTESLGKEYVIKSVNKTYNQYTLVDGPKRRSTMYADWFYHEDWLELVNENTISISEDELNNILGVTEQEEAENEKH